MIVPYLTIDILRQTAHMWEIEHDAIEVSLFYLFSSAAQSTFPQLRSINFIENLGFQGLVFESSIFELADVPNRLWILLRQCRCAIETCR